MDKSKTILGETIYTFLIYYKNNLDTLYESWEEFHKNIIQNLKSIKNNDYCGLTTKLCFIFFSENEFFAFFFIIFFRLI